MGFARLPGGIAADGASVLAENVATGETRTATSDGGGFYGLVGLAPGLWRVSATLGGTTMDGGRVEITAGRVATGDLATGRAPRRRLLRRP